MFSRLPARLTAALVSSLLVASALGATPAFAEDAVEPTPTAIAPVEEAEPEAATPVAEPVEPAEPTETPAPTPAEGFDLLELNGVIAELSEDGSKGSDIQLFHVESQGYLSLDFSHAPLDVTVVAGPITVTLAVPKGLDLGSTSAERFTALENYSVFDTALDVVTFEAVDSSKTPQGMINVLPIARAKHKIYAVPMTPADVAGSTITASQSTPNIQASVIESDAYWMEQSGGKIGFELVGVTGYYKSTFNCAFADPTNAGKLWTEGATRAAADLNFKEGPNKHLVLFFPSTADCGAAIGLGSIGTTPNTGGRIWAIGTQTPNNRQTLAHELGHNLSFGHANWLDCAAGQNPGTWTGCTSFEYGDVPDVMGYGSGDSIGGPVSSPNMIRSGVWGSDSYSVAPQGTTTYTIKALSTNSGKRSVIVEQADGVNYFIEFRDTTGRDAGFTAEGCATNSGGQGWCAATTAGVRILRLERRTFQFGPSQVAFKGFWGDDTQLLGRTVGGVRKVNYVQGESFSHQGIVVNVTNITGTSATVTVTRPSNTTVGGSMYMLKTSGNSASGLYVGDTYTAMLSQDLEADTYSYAWYRSNKAISGATKQSYTITAADKGKGLRVKVTLKSKDKSSRVLYDPANTGSAGYGWILAGSMVQGSVKVDSSAPALKAIPENWDTPGASLAYQWLRNGAAISGAKSSTYTATSADNGKSLSVKVTASKSGFNSLSATSAARNYTVLVTGGAVSVTGTAKVGATLSSTHNLTFAKQDPAGAIASPVISRQWLRNGAAIPTATGTSYTLTSADYGKVISLRVSGTTPGWSFASATSSATIKIAKGTIAGSLTSAAAAKNAATLELTASPSVGSVTETGVAYAYQWYRGTAAISKATKVVYKLTSADVGKEIKVRIVVSKSNYDSATLLSTPKIYSLQTTGAATIGGNQRVGQLLSVGNLTYTTADGAGTPDARAYQWYREGKAISGATAATFATTATDAGKRLTVRVIATKAGYLPHTVTTPATAKLAAGIFTGAPTVTVSQAASVLTVSAPNPANIAETGYTLSYQWYRGTAKISKATKASYTLTAADFGAVISAKVSVAKSKYTTLVVSSAGKNYSVMPNTPAPVVVADAGGVKVGATFSIAARSYTAGGPTITPTFSYQWLRDGKAIALATNATYVSGDADKGKAISVKVTAAYPNYLTSTSTSAATQKLGIDVLAGHNSGVTVGKSAGDLTLSFTGGVTDTGAKFSYQWLRGGVAIKNAVKTTYVPVAADFNKFITVRVTASKADHTTVVTTSTNLINPSVVPNYGLGLTNNAPIVGSTITVVKPSYNVGDLTFAYQWYAAGKAIKNATSDSFLVTSAQNKKAITVRVIASIPGMLPSTLVSSATAKVKAS